MSMTADANSDVAAPQGRVSLGEGANAIYVLTCTGGDKYSAMTRVSVESLRQTNPNVRVLAAMDFASAEAMRACKDPLLDEIDALLPFEAPDRSALFRNRYLKSKLRNLVEGQYLFLDSDMLIRGDLGPLFETQGDIGGAANRSKTDPKEQYLSGEQAIMDLMGWSVRGDLYLNGGLMLANDTPGARRFAEDWHDKWRAAHETLSDFRDQVVCDQTALNAAIWETGVTMTGLPREYNVQFSREPRIVPDARIWHYYASLQDIPITEFDILVHRLLEEGRFTSDQVRGLIDSPHPWRRHDWLDDVAARRVIARNFFKPADAQWFEGRRGASLRSRITELRHKAGLGKRAAQAPDGAAGGSEMETG